ncbi:MAG: glycosyltransferase [Helicobacteraceae bacterium]|nr:glycosyltransferase [Helicobacteraceae bacterium]
MNLNNDLTIGIVTSTYNRNHLLNRSILSVINQTYSNWILCVIDDCSTDQTSEMMQEFINDERIHYIQLSTNSGVNVVRNKGLDYLINEKKCDFISMLDDDDYFNKNTLLEAFKIIKKNKTHKWFSSNRVYPNGTKITQVDTYGLVSYLDYMVGEKLKGDVVPFISSDLIGNLRFSEFGLKGNEWHLFIQLKSNIFMYDFDSTVSEYLETGMTNSSKKKTPKIIKKFRRALEQNIIYNLNKGLTYESIEAKKSKNLLRSNNSIKNRLKYYRNSIRSYFINIIDFLGIYNYLIKRNYKKYLTMLGNIQ